MEVFKKYIYPLAFLSIIICLGYSCTSTKEKKTSDYPIRPVEFTKVNITDGFWKSRVDTASKVTIPYAFGKCEETGRVDNFIFAGGLKEGKFKGEYGFDDSDVYKILEGASYSLMTKNDPELRAYVDKLVSYIGEAQEEDGYLYTAWSLKANDYADMTCCSYHEKGQFIGSKFSHELYNVGHMYEAAVAHFQATATSDFLEIAIKNADLIYQLCIEEGQLFYPGHQEIEIGLVKLYRVTGNKNYLDLAKLFLDRRGKGYRNYGIEDGPEGLDFDAYSQDHKPVIEQDEAVGHSVRAGYMYAAMADIAAITGDKAYLAAVDKIWEDIVNKKIYITGGLGSGNGIEGFDVAYSLPNDAYAETCAAIANVYWNHRMFLLHGDSKYMDVLERTLYNGLITGLSLEGDKFFYPNPLEFDGENTFNQGAVCRSPWFNCSCCPSNLSRFVPSVSGYAYASTDTDVYVNLFMDNSSKISVNGKILEMDQKTNYPWSGKISLFVKNEEAIKTNLKIRIPGWSLNEAVPSNLYKFTNATSQKTIISVNEKPYKYTVEQGYAVISGSWKKGDKVEINFPMEVKAIKSHEKVSANKGKTAIQWGTLIYCAEGVDNQGHALDIAIDGAESFSSEFKEELINGVTVLNGKGNVDNMEVPVRLVPYYAWGHRDLGPMSVWLKSKR